MIINFLGIFLQTTSAPTEGSGMGTWINIIFLVAVMGVFYLFMIRPQSQKQKEEQKFLGNLKKGDKIVTIGGIHGKVSSVEDTTALVEVDSGGVKLRFEKVALKPFVEPAKNS